MSAIIELPQSHSPWRPMVLLPTDEFPGLPGQVPVDQLPTTPGEGPFVPEPTTFALLASVMLMIFAVKRYNKL